MGLFGAAVELNSGSGSYIKLPGAGNTLKVILLKESVAGYEYWTTENVGVRLRSKPQGVPDNIRINDKGRKEMVKQFHAWVAWDIDAGKAGVFQISQASILEALIAADTTGMYELAGAAVNTGIAISRTGSGLKTKYNVMPFPLKPAILDKVDREEVDAIDIDKALYGGDDSPADDIVAKGVELPNDILADIM